ncbi:hypothetical protein KKB80_11415 [bacterium]|nr:hypothetical protein [bacterium]
MRKKGIALLITLLFIIAITASITLGLKQINDASKQLEGQNFIFQTRVILDDVLNIIKNSSEINTIIKDDSEVELNNLISQLSFVPLQIEGLHVNIKVKSVRGKFNLNDLVDSEDKIYISRVEILKEFVSRYQINSNFIDLLLDNMGKTKEDISYNSAIFNDNPILFRDYITSFKHFDKIARYYEKRYNDDSIKNIDFDKIFYYSSQKGEAIDLNYATPELWQMLLGVDDAKAKSLSSAGGGYTKVDDLNLTDIEKERLAKFKTSFFEPFLDVEVEVNRGEQSAYISFEYDIKSKKGYNFVYEL